MKSSKKLVMAALMAALACVATMAVKIPSPLHGYINLGDCIVLMRGWLLPPQYGFLAAGIGSAMADVFSGYAAYAPATFVIKGLMAVVAYTVSAMLHSRMNDIACRVAAGISAEIVMVAGYLAFETALYGFVPSLANVPANMVQGTAGIIMGTILMKAFGKAGIEHIL